MEYVHLGRSGLLVSPLCLGTMNFGPHASEAESFRIMDRALEAGINFFDTADIYGKPWATGATESIIGRWLGQGGGRREKIVLATKVYDFMSDRPNESRLSALHIRRACDDSLRRLNTDHIDLYQMHHVDRDTPWDEIWQAMEQLVGSGKIIYVGTSNFAGWQIAQAVSTAEARAFLGPISEQSYYNLMTRTIELEVVPACRALGLGLLPYSPMSGGLLSGVLAKFEQGRRSDAETQEGIARHRKQLEDYENLCREAGHPPSQVALAWLSSRPGITAPIIGPRTLTQLEENIGSLEVRLSDDFLARLDAIWPGPGGEAPEAYAW